MPNDNTVAIEASSPPSTRAIGVIWLLYFLTGILGTLLTRGIVVSTDAASTANNILTHASLYRAGFAVDLVASLIYIASPMAFSSRLPGQAPRARIRSFCGRIQQGTFAR